MRLLIYEPSFRRLAARIGAHGKAVKPVLVRADGVLAEQGRPITLAETRPDAAWMSADVWGSPAFPRFTEAMLAASALTWVQSAAAGLDHPAFAQLVRKGVRLTTSHGQAVGMAEYVLAGVLDHFQRGSERRAAQSEGAWRRLPFREVMGSHWLMIGFGAIGQAVAERGRGFGARITGIRRSQAPHPAADAIAALEDLPRLLPEADVVVLAAPLTPATRHVANPAFFAAMKPGSVLVNVGRGGLVDERALLSALDKGVPEHVVLDVFETEPLPADSPLWGHPRVSLTPHASGITAGQDLRNDALFLENLRRFLAGEPLANEADPRDVPET